MENRILALRDQLSERGYDGFFSLSPAANAYLAGFHGTTSAVMVTATEAIFLCDFRYTEQAQTQVQGYTVREVAGKMESRVGEALSALKVAKVAYDPVVTTVYQRDSVAESFPGELSSCTALPGTLREVKDPGEIQKIRAASELAEGAMLDMANGLEAGVSEREAAALLEYEFRKRGAEGASFDSIVLFGARSSLPHGMPGDTVLKEGDIVLIDCGCIKDGYCSDLTRTFIFSTIYGDWFEEIYATVLNAQETALAAVRAGALCCDLDAIARDIITDAGYGEHFGHGLGHGVGLEVHETPRLNKESNAVLEAGMVVTVEPGIYLPGRGGVRIEDLVVVTEEGPDVLTRSPKDLKVLTT